MSTKLEPVKSVKRGWFVGKAWFATKREAFEYIGQVLDTRAMVQAEKLQKARCAEHGERLSPPGSRDWFACGCRNDKPLSYYNSDVNYKADW